MAKIEKAREFLQLTTQESEIQSQLSLPSSQFCFYEHFIVRGVQVDRVEPGVIVFTFKVPSRLTDRTGKLANGAIANLVDELGGAVAHVEGLPTNVSVDMSISYLSTAHADDELEITSRLLGRKGRYSGTVVLIRNKATGEIIAEGRHSLFGMQPSKM